MSHEKLLESRLREVGFAHVHFGFADEHDNRVLYVMDDRFKGALPESRTQMVRAAFGGLPYETYKRVEKVVGYTAEEAAAEGLKTTPAQRAAIRERLSHAGQTFDWHAVGALLDDLELMIARAAGQHSYALATRQLARAARPGEPYRPDLDDDE